MILCAAYVLGLERSVPKHADTIIENNNREYLACLISSSQVSIYTIVLNQFDSLNINAIKFT
jgi:hypothetical protein